MAVLEVSWQRTDEEGWNGIEDWEDEWSEESIYGDSEICWVEQFG